MEFERLELLINDKINLLNNKTIAILGVGGVGGYVAEALARCNIKKLILIDYDTISISNINRQIIALHSTIGKKKIDVLKMRINDINPQCEVVLYDIFYGIDNYDIIFNEHVDYIADCCDSIKSKEIIIEQAVNRKIKIISSMGAGNKLDPTKFLISKLKNTSYDKIAKKLRNDFKNKPKCLNIPVVYSKEIPIKTNGIGSISFVPSVCGLLIASYIVNDILKGESNEEK